MAQLEISVLGTFHARRGASEPISLHSRKQVGLLAYLACAGLGQRRETLATLLWDRSGDEQARASLRQALAVLRKTIAANGVEILVADHDRVSLAANGVWVDAVEFQRLVAEGTPDSLQRAGGLYRGRFLDGLSLGSEAFDDWVRAEGQRLEDLATRALSRLLAHHREQGAVDAAIAAAHRLLAIDPLYEDAHHALIDLHARQGARGEALRQYDRYREILQRELGVEPPAETLRLAQQVHGERHGPHSSGSEPARESRPGTVDVPLAGGDTGQPADIGKTAPAAAATRAIQGERRFVTVMSCSLADAAALSRSLDPEDLREIIAAFIDCCDRVVLGHGGTILHCMDHAVAACFGFPEADEHGAEHAVRAARAIVVAMGRVALPSGLGLRTRIGIGSGQVVAESRTLDGGGTRTTVTGEPPLVADALRAIAPPDGILVADNTKALLGTLFTYENLGARALEGFAGSARVWRVVEEQPGSTRFASRRGTAALTPLVGREEELALLARRWEQAQSGHGQVVVLAGDPGIGKSRLVEAQREALAGTEHVYLGYYCSPHHQESALYPVIQQLERAAGHARADPPPVKLAKVEALLAQAIDVPAGAAPLVAQLLSVPTEDRYPVLELTPQRRKEMTLDALEAQLVGLARRRPVLMVFEDVHWSDSTTRELYERLFERVEALPVLMIVTHRRGTSVPRVGDAHVSSLVVKRLPRGDSEALVAKVMGERPLPADAVAEIVDKADGVPLFLEELTKNLLEGGITVGEGPSAGTDRPPVATGIPDTLNELLLARLDRLGPAKAAAQEAAVIGRRFSYELLAAISTLEEPMLRDALARLSGSELVYAHGAPPSATYSFKHALVQDAIYASLLRSDRAILHGRIATVLEERFAEKKETEPEMLAHHFTAAGRGAEAIPYWQKAAERAIRHSAQHEAIADLDRALALLATLPRTPEHAAHELGLRVLLGQAWILAAGYAAPQVEAAFARARVLCEESDEPGQLFFVLLGLWQLYIAREELTAAVDAAQRLLQSTLAQHDPDFAIEAHVAQITTAYTLGDFAGVLDHANRAIALHESGTCQEGHIRTFGYDGHAISLIGASWALWALGYPDQSMRRMQEALARTREVAHPYTRCMVMQYCAWLHVFRNEVDAARERAAEGISLSIAHGFVWTQAFMTPLHGWALAAEGRTAEGIGEIREGQAALDQMGHRLWRPHRVGLLADACARAGEIHEALALVTQALEAVDETGELEHAVELRRQQGELVLRAAGPEATSTAERCFLGAIELARRQRAKSWELRAATSMARMLHDQGKRLQAREVLEPVYAWFTEGFDTRDMQDARTLLGQLDCASRVPRRARPARQ